MIGDVHYLNSGDWVESMSAVVEGLDRRFEVITYDDFCRRTHRKPKSGVPTNIQSEEPGMDTAPTSDQRENAGDPLHQT